MKYTLRTPAAVLIGIVFLGIGVIGIQASPTCVRFVKTYAEKAKRHTISKSTLERWADWNKAHPNYHPPTRRKPKMTPQETLSLVNLACQVPVTPLDLTSSLTPVQIEPVQISSLLLPNDLVPPPLNLVGQPPQSAPAPTDEPIPEPSSLLLLATGIAALVFFRKRLGMPAWKIAPTPSNS